MPEHGSNKRNWLKRLVLVLSIVVSLASQATAGGLDEAMEAMAEGDYHQGISILGTLAGRGNPEAQYLLGRVYSHGEGVKPDPVKALKWLERAADQLHFGAATTLGKMYASGMGVKINADLAAKWSARAAEIAEIAGEEYLDCNEYE